MYATCGSLSDAYKLFDHMALHEGMLIHVEIMDHDIQNDLYTIMLCSSFMLTVENRGCLVKSISWLVVVFHDTSWGRIVTSFPSILYFVADIIFKTNGRICFLKKYQQGK